jgi:hypothetical protein
VGRMIGAISCTASTVSTGRESAVPMWDCQRGAQHLGAGRSVVGMSFAAEQVARLAIEVSDAAMEWRNMSNADVGLRHEALGEDAQRSPIFPALGSNHTYG